MSMENVNDENFESAVLNSSLPVMVDFSASWCGPCKIIEPVVKSLADDYKDKVKIVKVDIEDAPNAARDFGVRSVPTVVFIKAGQEVDRLIGTKTKAEFVEKLNSL